MKLHTQRLTPCWRCYISEIWLPKETRFLKLFYIILTKATIALKLGSTSKRPKDIHFNIIIQLCKIANFKCLCSRWFMFCIDFLVFEIDFLKFLMHGYTCVVWSPIPNLTKVRPLFLLSHRRSITDRVKWPNRDFSATEGISEVLTIWYE